ncbi:vacuolar cation/proton exchanger 1a [Iris pallida]|uniref:Vacuolar cation/proton exchanger 1a n=1 Tax=Iris pallida TaxID=29817 RepID=A0AAX6GRR1_IRIPA|nr:vacuolar cation/proton exchanger 1a [Iris pallida]
MVHVAPNLSKACSRIMLLAYVAYLFFQVKTHHQLFEAQEVNYQSLLFYYLTVIYINIEYMS